ncbi:MAG: F0F1 ATP synthase subunit delta [Gammaproteobacteria bacterium]|nr:F0F1 ATP synthase subunit delta [Gammaproteobacteria bacterium]
MEIDWITVSAQIVNFLILVWLLKRFLYHPVMHAMEQREQRIAKRLNQAEEREQQASEQQQHYQHKTEELEQKRDEILGEVCEQAEQEKRQLLDEARDAVAETRESWQQQADQEKAEFFTQLNRETAKAIQAIARKALRDLADVGLEEQLIGKFIDQLEAADKDLQQTLRHSSGPLHIRTAYELDSTVRARLTRFIHEQFSADIKVEYSTTPELLCGIKLVSGDRQLGWNLSEYLDDLSERVDEAFSSVRPSAKQED